MRWRAELSRAIGLPRSAILSVPVSLAVMQLFWLEFLHFLAAMLAILLSISAGSLFLVTFRDERSTRTIWRSVGFLSLALAFFLFILERKFPSLGFAAVTVEVFGFISIYFGVLAEPKLARLAQAGPQASLTGGGFRQWRELLSAESVRPVMAFLFGVAVIIGGVYATALFIPTTLSAISASYILSILEVVSAVFIVLTIRIQIRRYQTESRDPQTRRNNLYPLVAYIFLFGRALSLIAYRLPEVDIVFLRMLRLDFGAAWIFSVALALIGFVFLTLWAWHFIRVRPFLRTYVVFLATVITVATSSALAYSLFSFKITERNNLALMANGANTHELVSQKYAESAALIAKLLGSDSGLVAGLRSYVIRDVANRATLMFDITDADIVRVYNRNNQVFFSPSDTRDNGRIFADDVFLTRALRSRQPVQTFDIIPGVLADQVAVRAIYPVSSSGVLLGAVEVGYIFDNAFLDFSKAQTGLDVTMYAGARRSASTIRTMDGVSRWVGSNETETAVLEKVLGAGGEYQTSLDRLGVAYYGAFVPVRNADDIIIGMVAVGTPAHPLLESFRQQLVSTFLIAIVLSLVAAMFGYSAIRSFQRRE